MTTPQSPKIYHIVHIDRLASIIQSGGLLSDFQVMQSGLAGTTIGMSSIKKRRLEELLLTSHPDLLVGHCVPFYFCPRSIMLYLIHQQNHPELHYQGGQGSIVHLQADLHGSVEWAQQQGQRWAFTLSNAGSYYFEDRCSLTDLSDLDWNAIQARQWQDCKEGKQAEFLVERNFPWQLVEKIGVCNQQVYQQVANITQTTAHNPQLSVQQDWYY